MKHGLEARWLVTVTKDSSLCFSPIAHPFQGGTRWQRRDSLWSTIRMLFISSTLPEASLALDGYKGAPNIDMTNYSLSRLLNLEILWTQNTFYE
jgi:hypothetical protein